MSSVVSSDLNSKSWKLQQCFQSKPLRISKLVFTGLNRNEHCFGRLKLKYPVEKLCYFRHKGFSIEYLITIFYRFWTTVSFVAWFNAARQLCVETVTAVVFTTQRTNKEKLCWFRHKRKKINKSNSK